MTSIAAAPDPLEVAIVGMGPRGLSVLERLLIRLHQQPPTRAVRIHVVDPGEHGAGRIWRTDQPDWLMMNTPTGEVTMYSGGPDKGRIRPGAGPSLHEWLAAHQDPRYARIGKDDYASRRAYGEYLREVFAHLTTDLPPQVSVIPTTARVVRIDRKGEDHLLFLDRDDATLTVGKVVLTTGHPINEAGPQEREFLEFAAGHSHLCYLRGDSAADLDLAGIRPGEAVGAIGLGLSFYDVLLSLTVGRGGRFEKDERGGLRYLPTGREPAIVAGSRSGLPLPARGRNQKAPDYRYQPRFLTATAVAAARERRRMADGSPQLDFREDVFPLLMLEVEHVYYVTLIRQRRGAPAAQRFAQLHLLAGGADPLAVTPRRGLLREFGVAEVAPVDLERLARPFTGQTFGSPADFHRQLLELLDQDIAEAVQGNVDNPLKAALDALRDLRSAVRTAVDFAGLRPQSHRDDFLRWFNPLNSLLSAGPPAIRVAQLQALIRQGTLTVVGPDARYQVDREAGRFAVWSPQVANSRRLVTVLVDARIPRPALRQDASALTRQLLQDGLVSEYANVDPSEGATFRTGGMAVTPAPYHVIDAFGEVNPNMYALGIPTEHTRWFTQIGNGRPGPIGGFHGDADLIAADVLGTAVTAPAVPATLAR